MLSPAEAKTMIGAFTSRMLKVSPPPEAMVPEEKRLPMNRLSTIQRISSLVMRKYPPHQRSNSRKRSASLSTLA